MERKQMSALLIRPAIIEDLHAMAELAEAKRRLYASWQPVFHRPHPEARQRHSDFIKSILREPDWILLVADNAGAVDGWLLARLAEAPPVYAPGGKVCMVDDFVVRDDSLWMTSGKALLRGLKESSWRQGAVLLNIVCGPRDGAKRALLQDFGLDLASEWWVGA
jgi:hypothetical protein